MEYFFWSETVCDVEKNSSNISCFLLHLCDKNNKVHIFSRLSFRQEKLICCLIIHEWKKAYKSFFLSKNSAYIENSCSWFSLDFPPKKFLYITINIYFFKHIFRKIHWLKYQVLTNFQIIQIMQLLWGVKSEGVILKIVHRKLLTFNKPY